VAAPLWTAVKTNMAGTACTGYPQGAIVQQLISYFLSDPVQSNLTAQGCAPLIPSLVSCISLLLDDKDDILVADMAWLIAGACWQPPYSSPAYATYTHGVYPLISHPFI
jgi:hypothetical protein